MNESAYVKGLKQSSLANWFNPKDKIYKLYLSYEPTKEKDKK